MGAVADVYALLQVVQPVVLGTLGAVTVLQWRRTRDQPTAWLAVTFATLAAVVIVSQLLPDRPEGTEAWLQKAQVLGIVAFPYLLFRFSASMIRAPRPVETVALLLSVATAVASVLPARYPAADEPRTALVTAIVVLLLAQWTFLLGSVAVRLWRAGQGQPAVARRRMRLLATASLILAVALLLAGSARPTAEPGAVQVVSQALTIVSALLFFVAFAPPAALRQAWRRSEEERLDAVEASLFGDLDEHEVAELIVPTVGRLIGGGVVLSTDDDKLVVSHGLSNDERDALLVDDPSQRLDPHVIEVPLRSGRLVIRGTACTPFFGQDELLLARRLATRADLALERVRSSRQLRQQAELLELASDGIFVRTLGGTIEYWNDGAARLYGWTKEEALGRTTHELLRTQFPSDPELALQQVVDSGSWEGQLVHATKDGSTVIVDSRWSLQPDPEPRILEINTDVTVRVRQEELRERFIANAAHELRTPLTALLGFAQVLGMPNVNESQTRTALEAIARSGQRLRTLVDNLLDLTRLQGPGERPQPEVVDLAAVVAGVVDGVTVPADVELRVDVADAVLVSTVPVLLQQVLTNLVTNAFRYGGPNVTVHGRRQGGRAVVSVADDGPGVEPEMRERLFDPFARGSTASAVGGSGLGLAIVKTAVEQLGGTIRYEDAHPRGARFVVELPAVR